MGNVIAETAGNGPTGATGTTREYIYLYETEIAPTMGSRTVVDRPLAVVSAVNTASPATYWVSVDHLNRPIKMTNAAKASVWDAVWQPWGGIHSITGSATLNSRFPGQWYQAETGLHYNWHRSYDPTVGRYTQPDPLGFVDGPSVYGYAGGSPMRFVDRDGQSIAKPYPHPPLPFPPIPLPQVPQLPSASQCLIILYNVIDDLINKYKDDPCKDALKRCVIASHGDDNAWEAFCSASRAMCKTPTSGTRVNRCRREMYSSQAQKRNWCYNEYGAD